MMFAIFVPVVGQEAEKNANRDKPDFEEEVEERPSVFSAGPAHRRKYARVVGHFKLSQGEDGACPSGAALSRKLPEISPLRRLKDLSANK
ncbi:MAG: hypothetical protein WCE51_12555 [Chthoniobacterales bacterium]